MEIFGKVSVFAFVLVGLFVCGLQILAWQTVEVHTELFDAEDSSYGRVMVTQNDKNVRYMIFDFRRLAQSGIDLNDPKRHVFGYTDEMVKAMDVLGREPQKMAFVGLGGGTVPRVIHEMYPSIQMDIAEIDPVVIDMAKKHFHFPKEMEVKVMDGREMLRRSEHKYDVIMLDAYNSFDIPFHLTTKEFLELTRSRLSENGIVISNVWSRKESAFTECTVNTYLSVFDEVIVRSRDENYVIISRGFSKKTPKGRILTDNWAPVNILRLQDRSWNL